MKNKFKWIGIALITAVLIFGFTGCPEPDSSTPAKSKAAELTEFKLQGATVVGEWPTASEIKAVGIASKDYKVQNFESEGAVTVTVKTQEDLAKAVTLTASKKAKIAFAVSNTFSSPQATDANFSKTSGQSAGFTGKNGLIVVRVTAEDKKTIKYYPIKVYVEGTDSSIGFVRFGTTAATTGKSGSALADFEDETKEATPGNVSLLTKDKTVALTAGHTSNVPPGQKIEYFHGRDLEDFPADSAFTVLPTGGYNPSSFATEPKEWVDEDLIIIKVTAQDKTTVSYYVVEVQIGRNIEIESFKVGGVEVVAGTGAADTAAMTVRLPVYNSWDLLYDPSKAAEYAANRAANAAAEALHGSVEPGVRPPAGDVWTVAATPKDGASITYGIGTRIEAPTTYAEATSLTLLNGEYIFIKVVSQNGKNTHYYMARFISKSVTTVLYGSPTVTGITSLDDLATSDFMEDDVEVLNINRVNVAEQAPPDYFFNVDAEEGLGHTSATARVLWDDEGVSVFVDVDFRDYEDGGKTVTRKYVPGNATHECDSVEIFINERYQTYKEGNAGSQYRIAFAEDGGVFTPSISGVAGNADASEEDNAIVTEFGESENYSIFLKPNNGGYVVVAKVPYRWVGNTNSTSVFNTDGTIKDTANSGRGAELGLELQLNVGGQSGGRECVLTWNGVAGQSYHNVKNYGIADFKLGTGRNRGPLVAAVPVITGQPADTTFLVSQLTGGDKYVTVKTQSGGGIKSYEWYKVDAATATTGGTKVGTNSASFRPAADVEATDDGVEHYYYVIVTNTRGTDTKTAQSRTVTITVSSLDPTPEDIIPGARKKVTVPAGAQVLKTKAQLITDGVLIAKGSEVVTPVENKEKTDTVIVVEGSTLGAGLQLLAPNTVTVEAGYDYYIKFVGRGYTPPGWGWSVFKIALGTEWNATTAGETNCANIDSTIKLNQSYGKDGDIQVGTPITYGLFASRNTNFSADIANLYVYSIDDIVIYRVLIPVCASTTCNLKGKKTEEVATGTYCNCYDWDCVVCQAIGPGPVKGTPALTPLVLNGTSGLIFEQKDGADVDFKVLGPMTDTTTGAGDAIPYDGLSAKIDLTKFTGGALDIFNYNRVSVKVEAYSDAAGQTLVAAGEEEWTATLFRQWVGYAAEDFPAHNDPLNSVKNKRMMTVGGKDPKSSTGEPMKVAALERLPEGIRVERNGNVTANKIKSMKIISVTFFYAAPPAPLNASLTFQGDGKGGVIDTIEAETGYAGITAKLDFTSVDTIGKFNRITIVVKAYSDTDATEEITGTTFIGTTGEGTGKPVPLWNATLFRPWNDDPDSPTEGYGGDTKYTNSGGVELQDFPPWVPTPDGANGRMQQVGSDVAAGATSILTEFPEGFRVERNGADPGNPVKALKIVSFTLSHTDYVAP